MDDHADDVHRWLGGTDGNEFDNRLDHRLDILQQKTDDNRWYHELPDARVRKFTLLGPPIPNTDVELEIPTYAFFPGDSSSDDDTASSRPAIVLVHGGIHDNFSTKYVSVVRELLDEGYVVVSPEYRGSTGYGREHYEAIDYGGHEIADTLAARNWAADRAEVDDERIGVVGWSHGGLHALLSVFRYPDSYAVAYAGAPVSDLLERWKYKDEGYHRLYTANYHLGTTPDADPDRYRKRSPAHQAVATGTPLRINATTTTATSITPKSSRSSNPCATSARSSNTSVTTTLPAVTTSNSTNRDSPGIPDSECTTFWQTTSRHHIVIRPSIRDSTVHP
ncbi:hypothetical protein A4G99_13550 [Haladaptatus sp. R4]|uniref:alpha/beta hydrolase family protein n=1 Tax=Haladaptatus sp. R4 TaxID=1679489 RepID=UPI0007B493BC|nr:alpha/beta fold hydrolase [Haladaptatus sp. R4]KZN23863.1 hypothetical protein A4G99_13550 [Haladaptatus sp. R4]